MAAPFNLNSLNPPQREAVQHLHGPLLILAGAGTGKTRVIACRTAHMVRQGIPPQNILAVTFTNKASREMRERIGGLVSGDAARQITISTFHSFCARLLRRHIPRLGYSAGFAIASESYQIGLIRTIASEFGYVGEGHDPEGVRSAISLAKNHIRFPQDVRDQAATQRELETAAVYEEYQKRLKSMDLLDFDDLLLLVHQLWHQDAELLATNQEQYRYLMVDEYQDTNPVQFSIVATLAGKDRNLAVVGDDDQSIYGWRGATVENILSFGTHFPGAKVIRLEQNYRSTTTILDAANEVIAKNPKRHPKKLWSGLGQGEKILAVNAVDDEAEARFITDLIRDWKTTYTLADGDFAILFRSNHQSRLLETAMRQARIPYTIVGSNSFFERKEILDALSFLQLAFNPKDDLSLLRILNVPPRGLGDKAVDRLRELRTRTGMPLTDLLTDEAFTADLAPAAAASVRTFANCMATFREAFRTSGDLRPKIDGLLTQIGYIEGLGRMYKPREDALNRRDNVLEFVNAAAEFDARHGNDGRLGDFLEGFALMDQNDRSDRKDGEAVNTVSMMTVHAAKGLEFPAVIVTGLEHGLFPHDRAVTEGTVDEERRLFYVAITRAQRHLALTYSDKRKIRGALMRRRPSNFLQDLPEAYCTSCSADKALAPATAEATSDFFAQMKAQFKPQ